MARIEWNQSNSDRLHKDPEVHWDILGDETHLLQPQHAFLG